MKFQYMGVSVLLHAKCLSSVGTRQGCSWLAHVFGYKMHQLCMQALVGKQLSVRLSGVGGLDWNTGLEYRTGILE